MQCRDHACLADLISRARSGGLRSSELSDATITVTNLGEQGVEEVYGVIYPPQVALVGFGKVLPRPWADGGSVVVRQTLRVTLIRRSPRQRRPSRRAVSGRARTPAAGTGETRMTRQDIRAAVIDALSAIAPEGDYAALRGGRPLRDQLDIDSFDFLNVVIRPPRQARCRRSRGRLPETGDTRLGDRVSDHPHRRGSHDPAQPSRGGACRRR